MNEVSSHLMLLALNFLLRRENRKEREDESSFRFACAAEF